ncbi:MAG: helix-turn-helix domain containing protein [Acidimicrobiia bacterium]|nr:helix-turn-helix domain containing protein [Acidimicrobiia bacterium]
MLVLVELNVVEQRYQAVLEVLNQGATVTDVARRNGVTRQTVHAWLHKYASRGLAGLADGSAKPLSCPHQMTAEVEARVVTIRREHPGWGQRTRQIVAGGQMLDAYDLEVEAPVPGRTSRYSTGEAAWAMAQLHNLFPTEGWDEPARRVLDYLATERDEVEGLAFPPWADQWAAYTLGELAPSGLDPHHVTYARALAARFGMLVRSESQKDGWPVPFVDPRARAAGIGVWVEGVGALVRAAEQDNRLADDRPALETRLTCGGAIIAGRQQDGSDAAAWAAPGLVEGAWFRDDVTRMDDQQHALSGLLAAAGELGPVGS